MESPKGEKGSSEALAWDDLTGMRLDGDKVKEARFKHIQYVRDKNVWSKVPRKQALARGWKTTKTRRIDTNKDGDATSKFRIIIAGKEFKT